MSADLFVGFVCGVGSMAAFTVFCSFLWPFIARRLRRLNPEYAIRDHCTDCTILRAL